VAISKYLDFRYFDASRDAVNWISLYEIVKNTNGIETLPDQYFYPRIDIGISTYLLPRMRSFLMLDMSGAVISNLSGTISPVYYPSVVDASYMATVLGM